MAKQLLKGNEAFAEAAIRAGCEGFFGYPITPSTEFLEYMAKRMPELGRAYVQAESEVAAINMVYGAACTGKRVMTASSSPGISLMMEGISYIVGSEVPVVLVDIMRGGPGLGNIAPAQADYTQMVHGGGHGDYRIIVLAPSTVQELVDLTYEAFDIADRYRTVVAVIADGSLGQMMEPAVLPPMREVRKMKERPEWALTGAEGRDKNIITSIYLEPLDEEAFNQKLLDKQALIEQNEVRYVEEYIDDAEIVVIGFGTSGRVSQTAVTAAREQGIKVGLHRPISLYPFPEKRIEELARQAKEILVVEMNSGQMLQDVRLAVEGVTPISFYGRMGGVIPLPDEVLEQIKNIHQGLEK